jgi:uncharacterized protein (TIGR00255 family)
MTGHGCGEGIHEGCRLSVEVSSVNRRHAEIAIHLPQDLDVLEARMREEIARHISRGRISVRVSLDSASGREGQVRVNHALAAAYAREFTLLANALGLEDRPGLDSSLQAPGVLEAAAPIEDSEACWPALSGALRDALAQLVRMRELEGEHLARDLGVRLGILREAMRAVRDRAPEVAEYYRKQLRERIAAAGIEWSAEDSERILREVALFADRCDISEELTRLESHVAQFEQGLKTAEPIGRTLDFLAQEMHREVNTIGSKANDAAIAREVVRLKTELERIREQAQNIE